MLLTVFRISVPVASYAQDSKYYSVTITESGLPSGTDWPIYVNGSEFSSNNSTIVFMAENGSHSSIRKIYSIILGTMEGKPATFFRISKLVVRNFVSFGFRSGVRI